MYPKFFKITENATKGIIVDGLFQRSTLICHNSNIA